MFPAKPIWTTFAPNSYNENTRMLKGGEASSLGIAARKA